MSNPLYIALDHGHGLKDLAQIKVFKTADSYYNFREKNSSINHRWNFMPWGPNYPTKSGSYIHRIEKIDGINQHTYTKA